MEYNTSDPLSTVDKIIRINEDLMIHLDSTIRWLLHYCKKNNITPPNLKILNKYVLTAHEYLNYSPNQPTGNTNKTTEDETEPVLGFCKLFVRYSRCQKSSDRNLGSTVLMG